MKRLFALCGFALAVLVGAKFSPARSATNDEQVVRQLNEQSLKAFDVKDDVTLDKLEADDFDILSEDGVQTKQDHLKEVRDSKSHVFPISRTVENQKIRIYGNTALVTQLDHAASGGASSSYQSTFVWVRHGGDWKLVHLHFTKVS